MIASMYGMNFKFMPELTLALGYPMALAMMVGSAVVTYAFFRWKGWL
ncbi:CorA family divalent cation transporter [Cypionkella sp.]